MKSNNFIDTTSDDYYLNPYKFKKKINNNDNSLLSNNNSNLNLIIKTLTSIIMNNDETNDNNVIELNNNKSNNIETKNFDKFIIFKLIANNQNDKLHNLLANNDSLYVNIQDNDGDTALHIAIFLSNYDACNILIKNKANIFIKDKWGQTPLHRICFSLKNKDMIKIINLICKNQLILNENNNIFNCIDNFNNTPLHLVIKYIIKNNINLDKNILAILQKLISLTDINLINNDGLSGKDLINMLNLSY
jgi:ankyrin repeat protein